MLGSFMEEMNITPEQFEIACMEGKNLSALSGDEPGDSHSFSFHKGLFQQIWAANDIRTFVKLMVQRNIELQLQALDLIERRQASLQEAAEDNLDIAEEHEVAEIEKSVQVELSEDVNPIEDENDKFRRLNLFFEKKEQINTSDVVSRQEYLREQRDKILQIKKQARARQLKEETAKERPKSARAAIKIIEGKAIEPDEASVQLRKILAKKLRDEVVNNKSSDKEDPFE